LGVPAPPREAQGFAAIAARLWALLSVLIPAVLLGRDGSLSQQTRSLACAEITYNPWAVLAAHQN
jgi:hypothetical protein